MEPVRAAPSVAEMAEAWVTAKAGGRAQKRAGGSAVATGPESTVALVAVSVMTWAVSKVVKKAAARAAAWVGTWAGV